jgi:glycine betaine/choline ABC-type transport system substrate-binding protein
MRFHRFLVAVIATALLIAAPALAQVRVGSKNFTEQFIVAELYAQALEAAGIKVERKINLGGTLIAHKALEEKQIDFYPEYTGTMLIAVLKGEPMTDRKAVYDKVKAEYAAKGLVVLNETPFQNTYNMVVRPETAAQYKLETLTDQASALASGIRYALCVLKPTRDASFISSQTVRPAAPSVSGKRRRCRNGGCIRGTAVAYARSRGSTGGEVSMPIDARMAPSPFPSATQRRSPKLPSFAVSL